MRKLKYWYLLGLFSFCFFFLAQLVAQQKEIEAVWVPTPVAIDGNNNDWAEAILTTEKNVAVNYAFRHDGQNLYILFVFNDPKFLSTINATGMSIYFSPANKKSKDFGIKFISKNLTGEQLIALMEKQGIPLAEDQKAQFQAKPQARYLFYEADIIGKKGETIAPPPTEGVAPPAFRVGRSGKSLVYEFRVPLVSRETYAAGIGFQPGQPLRVGFEWGGMTQEMRSAMMARMAEQGTTARASDTSLERTLSGEGEGEGMMMGGGSGPRLGSTPKKYSFWVNLKLSPGEK